MPTDSALLAQLQTLWRAATPPGPEGAPPPAVSTAAPPEPSSAKPHSEGTDQDSAEHFAPDDQAELRADVFDGIAAGEQSDDQDPFDLLDDQSRAYLLGRHRHPERCGFCGGHDRHHPRCVALCDEWAVAMPFGKHKGRPIRNLDTDYLRWIRKSSMTLNGEVADEINRVLDQRKAG